MFNKIKFILLPTVFFATAVFAKKTDGQFVINQKNSEIEITTKSGYHLNKDAPAFLLVGSSKSAPKIKTEKLFVFLTSGKAEKATLSFYVCDDAKTVCEQQKAELTLAESKNKDAVDVQKQTASIETAKIENKDSKNENKKSDKKNNKFTLLVFSAPWCPACIRLHSETLNDAKVKRVLKNIQIEEVNIDLVENEKKSEEYGVKAIPTMVLLNKQNQEVYRWLDYQPKEALTKDLAQELKHSVSFEDLKTKAAGGDQKSQIKLAYYEYSKMNFSEAAKWFAFAKTEKDKNFKLSSEVSAAEEAAEDSAETMKQYKETLQRASTLTTSVVDQLRWKLEFLELSQKENEKDFLTNNQVGLKQLSKDLSELLKNKNIAKLYSESTIGEIGGFNKEETAVMLIKANKLLNQENEVLTLKLNLEKELAQYKVDLTKPGYVLNLIYYYTQAGSKDALEKAHNAYKELIAQNNKTYVYFEKYSNFLVKQKMFKEALANIESAIQYSEGNFQKLQFSKAKILKELGQKKEALSLLEEVEASLSPESKKQSRLKTQIDDFKKKLE